MAEFENYSFQYEERKEGGSRRMCDLLSNTDRRRVKNPENRRAVLNGRPQITI